MNRLDPVLARTRMGTLVLALALVSGCGNEPSHERLPDAAQPSRTGSAPLEDAAAASTTDDDAGAAASGVDAAPVAHDAGPVSAASDAGSQAQADAQQADAQADAQPADRDAAGDASAQPDARAACNALPEPRTSTLLRLATHEDAPSWQPGGNVREGTYRLEDAVKYALSAPSASVPEARNETIVIRGDVWQRVAYWDNRPTTRFTQRARFVGTSIVLEQTCGDEPDTQIFSLCWANEASVTANAQRFLLQTSGESAEQGVLYVLTYVRVSD